MTYDIPVQPFAYGDAFAWLDSTQTLWTQPAADASVPPAKHAQIQLKNLGGVTLAGAQGYLASGFVMDSTPPGPPGIFTFSIDVGQPTLLANLLPPNYPLGPMANPGAGPTTPVVGPKRIFWAECWGNGVSLPVPGTSPPEGQDAPNSWVLRAVAPTGGVPETIDSFTWTDWMPQSPGFDTCPEVATDGTAVYWTHGSALMRLCD